MANLNGWDSVSSSHFTLLKTFAIWLSDLSSESKYNYVWLTMPSNYRICSHSLKHLPQPALYKITFLDLFRVTFCYCRKQDSGLESVIRKAQHGAMNQSLWRFPIYSWQIWMIMLKPVCWSRIHKTVKLCPSHLIGK